MRDWRAAPLDPTDRALCELATKLTLRQQEMSPSDLEALRELGCDDRAIHDAVQVIGYFNYVTRVADGLGVDAEDSIAQWGKNDRPNR